MNKKANDQIKKLESFLISLREKTVDILFFDISDYEYLSTIGSGATSDVKVVRKKNSEEYAMKELKLYDHKSMQRFLMECEILFKLRHPCIVRIYGINYGDDTHKPSIILSLEPESLETAINSEKVSEEEKNRIAVEIVVGMRYIHSNKIMHRDLKPLNILLSKNRHVRITDFGLAKEEDISTSQSKGVGTMRFMAPELFDERDTNYTNKIDVYSFGIILFFIITNKYPPFIMKNVVTGIPPKLPENITKWVSELIISCLSVDPESRPSFTKIFEIMKENNYNMFSDSKDKKLTNKQIMMKKNIETRVLKIEAFEFQHNQK